MDKNFKPLLKGRGALTNTPNRFEKFYRDAHLEAKIETNCEIPEEAEPSPQTQLLKDSTRSAIAHNESPDVGFSSSINPYRGCEHGCIYCYARPFHEYLGFSAGIDFETKILMKENLPELLRKELNKKSWKPETLAMSGVTDPYQPVERKLEITRGCLKVLAEFKNPVVIITKNHLVTRDIDILKELSAFHCVGVYLSITTLDSKLCEVMEPRTSRPAYKLKAIEALAKAGVPVGVMNAPIIPGLTDHEVPEILKKASEAGAQHAGYTVVRLPLSVETLFIEWLEKHKPDRKEKVLNRLRSLHEGKLYDTRFGHRMRGEGVFAEQIDAVFKLYCKKQGLNKKSLPLSTEAFRRPNEATQLSMEF